MPASIAARSVPAWISVIAAEPGAIGRNTRLGARVSARLDASSTQFVRDHDCRDDLARSHEKVALAWLDGQVLHQAEQRVGGVRVARAAHSGDDEYGCGTQLECFGHAVGDGSAPIRSGDGGAAELHDDDGPAVG